MINKSTVVTIIAFVLILGAFLGYIVGVDQMKSQLARQDATHQQDLLDLEKSLEGVVVGGGFMVPRQDIVDNILESQDHSLFVRSIELTDRAELFRDPGPITVFAPTNEAFEKRSAIDGLMELENKDKLADILKYHVVVGKFTTADLVDGMKLKTVQGRELTLTKKNDVWWINDIAKITVLDIVSSNGVLFVTDALLIPPSTK